MPTEAKGVVSRIWLLEDNLDDTTFIEAAFRRCSPSIEVASFVDGDAMLRELRDRSLRLLPNLILLDLNLPTRDGHDILAELKSDPAFRQIPVIVLTASHAERDVRKSYAAHANAHVSKPYDFREYEALTQSIAGFWLRWAATPASPPAPVFA